MVHRYYEENQFTEGGEGDADGGAVGNVNTDGQHIRLAQKENSRRNDKSIRYIQDEDIMGLIPKALNMDGFHTK